MNTQNNNQTLSTQAQVALELPEGLVVKNQVIYIDKMLEATRIRLSTKLNANKSNVDLCAKYMGLIKSYAALLIQTSGNLDHIKVYASAILKRDSTLRIKALCDMWLKDATYRLKPGTIQSYTYALRYLKETLGEELVVVLGKKVVARDFFQAYVQIKPYSFQKQLKILLTSMFDLAVNLDYVEYNPFSALEVKSKPNPATFRNKSFTLDEIQTIMSATIEDSTLKTYLEIAIGTGARPSEIIALSFESFDHKAKSVNIRQGFSGEVLTTPKTKSSQRVVYIDQRLSDYIFELSCNGQKTGFIFKTNLKPKSLVRALGESFKTLLKKLEIKTNTLYGLRHTYTTLNLQNGADVKIISQMLGHANTSMTMDVYNKVQSEGFKPSFLKQEPSLFEYKGVNDE
ncbi:site-specific integrase [Helicobacter sp. 11S02629-2]|uniref:tyrosine-type recombinase/integrase n=1 Tax=Helicobacter sp. 11S02629-2 TaxID=1476195 RepID=UPI000BA5F509|nr:site-specific integrase [Helicobacter sp. 11S02629-2]PAF42736.1 hypothetical protein BKH40_07525 [Helicobacter sp. 11S02629-2]